MERISMTPRPGWEQTIQRQGLIYNEALKDGRTVRYWNENAAYKFTMAEVLELEKVTDNLHRMSVEAARFLAEEQLNPASPFAQMGISREGLEYARESLYRNDPDIYGRFDLVYSGPSKPAKMLEYNADTPTGLVEGSIVQWYWFEDLFTSQGKEGYDQWNGIHEALVGRFRKYREYLRHDVTTNPNPLLHFGYTALDDSGEDVMTVEYLRECALQAGFTARDETGNPLYDEHGVPLPMAQRIEMTQIGYNWDTQRFVDEHNQPIDHIFKLYPWEDLVSEEFGEPLTDTKPRGWIEPAWKMFLSNKMLSAALWYLYPYHENLVKTFVDEPRFMDSYVKKPLHGREGDNIELHTPTQKIVQPGRYGAEGYVFQELVEIPNFRDEFGASNYPILGSWVIDGESFGVGIRESDGPITDYYCRFVPNIIKD